MLTGCTSTQILGPAQKEDLKRTGLSVDAVTQAEEAQQAPNPTTEPNYSNSVPAAAGGGLLGALVGAAIDAPTKADQKSNFSKNYSQYFDSVEQNMPQDISASLNVQLQEVISNNDYFAPLVTENSTSKLKTTITSYGIQRSQKLDNEIYLTFGVSATLALDTGLTKPVFNRIFIGLAEDEHLMKDYAEQPELLTKMSEQAIVDLAQKMKAFLDEISVQNAE